MGLDPLIQSLYMRDQKKVKRKRNQTLAFTTPLLSGEEKEKTPKRTLEFAAYLLAQTEISIIDVYSLISTLPSLLAFIKMNIHLLLYSELIHCYHPRLIVLFGINSYYNRILPSLMFNKEYSINYMRFKK